MAYVNPNFKTKKALKEAVAARVAFDALTLEERGLQRLNDSQQVGTLMGFSSVPREVEVFQPGLGTVPQNGTISLEGPHFPEPHRWYGTGHMKDGKLVKVT